MGNDKAECNGIGGEAKMCRLKEQRRYEVNVRGQIEKREAEQYQRGIVGVQLVDVPNHAVILTGKVAQVKQQMGLIPIM